MIDRFGRGLFASSAIVAMVAATPAMAQTRSFNVPAQSAETGIAALGRQADIQIVAARKFTKGKKTNAVRGSMTVDAALRQLLEGTGLTFRATGAQTYMVVQGGNAAAAPARSEASVSGSDGVVVPSALASTVVDARTGAALKGALVEIVETGERASTGDLGEFRFPGKNGSYNLRISYLGYPRYEQFVDLKDGRATSGILLSDGSASGEIVVTAYQSARAQALNQERTSENTSTVVSADLLGQFDGTTISDALRRTPGIAFVPDETTGDGRNVIVRGLEPDFNTVTFNGLRLPVGNGRDRSPALGNILADSVSKITINKTLLPNQDGSGTGALIEIETKGPLDRPDRYFNISAEKAFSGKKFLDENFLSGTASFKFGEARNFGVSASVQYRKRSIKQVNLANAVQYPQYLPATDGGRPVLFPSDIDPRRPFPYEDGIDAGYPTRVSVAQNESTVENLAIGVSAQWQIGNHTDLKLDFNQSTSTNAGYDRTGGFDVASGLESLPIDELGGEIRRAYVWETADGQLPLSIGQSYGIRENVKDETTGISFVGRTAFSQWEFDYKAGYTIGKVRNPGTFSASFFSPTFLPINLTRDDLLPGIAANTIAGRIVSPFIPANGIVASLPGLSPSGIDKLNSEDAYSFAFGSTTTSFSQNERATGAFDVKYNFESSVLKYLQAGVFFERSTNEFTGGPGTEYYGSGTMRDLGLALDTSALGRIGMADDFRVLSKAAVYKFRDDLVSGRIPGVFAAPYEPGELEYRDGTAERDIAAYLQAAVSIGRLEIVGGFRVEKVKTNNNAIFTSLIFREDGSLDLDFLQNNFEIRSIKGNDTNFLPRVQANFRLNDNLVMRAGYYLSIARPDIRSIGGATTYRLDLQPFYGPSFNQPLLAITQGNPGLRSATTNNFDLSLEWYSDNIGVMKIGAFYKPTKRAFFQSTIATQNVLPDGLSVPDDPRFQTPNLWVEFTRPENSDTLTRLWGAELAIERKFNFLPGFLSGLGVYGNYTYTDSSQKRPYFFFPDPSADIVFDTPYNSQPKHSGTIALTYSKSGFDASVSYTRQSRYIVNWAPQGLSNYREAVSSLDLRAQYQASIGGMDTRFYIEGSNLLKDAKDPNFRRSFGGGAPGVPTYAEQSSFLGGRTIRLGVSASF